MKAGLEEALGVNGSDTDSPGMTRREFLKAGSVAAVGLSAVGLEPMPQKTLAAQPQDTQEIQRRFARGYPKFLPAAERFLERQRITGVKPMMPANLPPAVLERAKVRYQQMTGQPFSGFDFNGFYREYAPGTRDKFLTDYGRTWIYTQALVLYDLVMRNDRKEAKALADALVHLGKQEEALGFEGGWHFSYNTIGDPWLDPRAPTGNNLWALSALYAAMLATQDFTHLQWVNQVRKRVLEDLQVMDQKDFRYGLIQGMRFTEGLRQINPATGRPFTIDDIGYRAYEGNVNQIAGDIATEHQFDAANTLRLAYLANEAAAAGEEGKATEQEIATLVERHRLLMVNLMKMWMRDPREGDHFVTGITYSEEAKRWRLNRSVAVDNNSWAGVILPYSEDRAWEAIQYVKRNFVIRQRIGGMLDLPESTQAQIRGGRIKPDEQIIGTLFFLPQFADRFIEDLVSPDDPDRALWAQMLQPEATFGLIHFLIRFAQRTSDEKRRKEAQALAEELMRGMMRLHELYGGEGLPYATLAPKLFTTLRSATATATGAIVFRQFQGAGGQHFLMVEPPSAMMRDITLTPPHAGLEESAAGAAEPPPFVTTPLAHYLPLTAGSPAASTEAAPVAVNTEQPVAQPSLGPTPSAKTLWDLRTTPASSPAPAQAGLAVAKAEPEPKAKGRLAKAAQIGVLTASLLGSSTLEIQPGKLQEVQPKVVRQEELPSFPVEVTIQEKQGGEQRRLEVEARQMVPPDRIVAPSTHVSRSPLRSAWQRAKSFLAAGQRGIRWLLLGPERRENWLAWKSPEQTIVPPGQEKLIFPVYDPRAFFEEGPHAVQATLSSFHKASSSQGSKAAIALEIGGFIDFRDYPDAPSPVGEYVTQKVQDFIKQAHDIDTDLKVYLYSSDRGLLEEMGGQMSNLRHMLAMGFDREAIVLNWKIWATEAWKQATITIKKQMAWRWFKAHQRVLDEVIPEQEITPLGRPTSVYSLVNSEFPSILAEVLEEKDLKEKFPDRLRLVIMAYDYPEWQQGKEAGRTAAELVGDAKARLGQPVGLAFNLEPGEDPSLYQQVRNGTAREVIQGALEKSGTTDQPVVFHVPDHHALMELMRTGWLSPARLLTQRRLDTATGPILEEASLMVGNPRTPDVRERKWVPVPIHGPVRDTIARFLEARSIGLREGPTGLSVWGAIFRNLDSWLRKGILTLDVDTGILGPETGLTTSALLTLAGGATTGNLEATQMGLIATRLDDKGNPMLDSGGKPIRKTFGGRLDKSGEFLFDDPDKPRILGDPSVIQLGAGRWTGELVVRLKRPEGVGLGKVIVGSLESVVSIGWPGSGGTPDTETEAVSFSALQKEALARISLGELRKGPSYFTLKARDSESAITGWYGPGLDTFLSAQFLDALVDRLKERLTKEPGLRAQMGSLTELQLAIGGQGDLMASFSLEEFTGEAQLKDRLERLKGHEFTHLSVATPKLEELATRILPSFDPGKRGTDEELAPDKQTETLKSATRIAHEKGLRVGLRVDAAQIDRLSALLKGPLAKAQMEAAESHGIILNSGLDLLRLIVQSNEMLRLELDFIELSLKDPAGEVQLRKDMERLMEALDIPLIVTGPEGGDPSPWAQYATRLDAGQATPEKVREILQRPFPGLIQRARHRFPQAIILEGGSLDEILDRLDERFPRLVDDKEGSLINQIIERIKIPSVTTLRSLMGERNDEKIQEVQRWAKDLDRKKLLEALSGQDPVQQEMALLVILARAYEVDRASEMPLGLYQTAFEKAILAAHGLKSTPVLVVGDTRPEVRPLTPPDQDLKSGEEPLIRVGVKNAGDIPARYQVAVHLMAYDTRGNLRWPASKPRVEQFVSMVLEPGQEQVLPVKLKGNFLNEPGRIDYRILARDANTPIHLPGQRLGLSPEEAEQARVGGSIFVGASSEEVQRRQGVRTEDLARKFLKKMEELRRQEKKENLAYPEYQKSFEQRLREFVGPGFEVQVKGTPQDPQVHLTPKPQKDFVDEVKDAQAQIQKALEKGSRTVSLVSEKPERWRTWLLRHFYGALAAGGLVAWGLGLLIGSYRTLKQGWAVAAHQADLLRNRTALPPGVIEKPQGAVTRAISTAVEWVIYVEGIGARLHQTWAHLHPEQGKVSRAMVAHGKVVIVLDDEVEDLSQHIERQRLTRLGHFQRFASWWVTAALFVFPVTVGLALWGFVSPWAVFIAAMIPLLGGVLARAPPLRGLNIAFFLVAPFLFLAGSIPLRGLNIAFFLVAPFLFLAGSIPLISLAIPLAYSLWWPMVSISGFATLWTLHVFRAAREAGIVEKVGTAGTVWRLFGAFTIGALGASAVAWLYTLFLPGWQFWLAGFAIYRLVRTATRIFVEEQKPLQAYGEWLLASWHLVKLALILGFVYYFFAVLHPLLYGWWEGLVSKDLSLSLPTLVKGIAKGAGAFVSFFLIGFRYELTAGFQGKLQGLRRGWIRWPLTAFLALSISLSMPTLLGFLGMPLIWASYIPGIGMFSYAVGHLGRAVELWQEKPKGQRAGFAFFRGGILGIGVSLGLPALLFFAYGGSASLAVGLSYWLGLLPTGLVLWALAAEAFSWLQFKIQDQFEHREVQLFQHRLAIRHLADSGASLRDPVLDLDAASLSTLREEFRHLADQAQLSSKERRKLLKKFGIRRSPDEMPLEQYDPNLFNAAWKEASDNASRHRVKGFPDPPSGRTSPVQLIATLTPEQQRLLNLYYGWLLAQKEAEAEVRRQTNQAIGLAGLPKADQEMAVIAHQLQTMNKHKDTLLNQDQGTTVRSFGGWLWTGSLKSAVARLRKDDRLAVIMPALILSLEWNKDFNWAKFKNFRERYGLGGALVAWSVVGFLQVLLTNFAVPLGFLASMINRWGRWNVQGGNVMHTLRLSADAGMAGYVSAFGYVLRVIGRWLVGFLYNLMEFYLGRRVVRGELEEYLATQRWIPKAGTIAAYIHQLMSRPDFSSLVAAFYAGITGVDNSVFEMGRFLLPPNELRQIYWGLRRDGPGGVEGVHDDKAFGRDWPSGTIGWRTVPPGGHLFIPTRHEIVLEFSLGGGAVLEKLSDKKTVRIRRQDGSLQYLPDDGKEVQTPDLGTFQNDVGKSQYRQAIQHLLRLNSNLRLPNPNLNLDSAKLADLQQAYQAIGKAQGLSPEQQGRLVSNFDGPVIQNGQPVKFPDEPTQRLSEEPGKLHLVLPGLPTKGVNVGAGVAYFLGLVEPKLKVSQKKGGGWSAQVVFEKVEDKLFPELDPARRTVQDPNDRLKGERATLGREAAREILKWRDQKIREKKIREGKKLDPDTDIVRGEAGHHQVKDFKGQLFQFKLNFFRWLLTRLTTAKKEGKWRVLGWWTATGILSGVLLFYLVWVRSALMLLVLPVLLGHLFGILYPISFIGFTQHNRLQGMRGHYESEMVERAFQGLEREMDQTISPRPGAGEYLQTLISGEDLISKDEDLQKIAELYPKVLGPEDMQFTFRRPFRYFMTVEPKLAKEIKKLAERLKLPDPEPRSRWEARQLLEKAIREAIIRTSPRGYTQEERRAIFEALRMNTAGELLAIGNVVAGTQYARSRDPNAIRVGDVNAQYGVEGQDPLKRMMLALGYPNIGDRSWAQSSWAAFYGGVPIPSMMYSLTGPDEGADISQVDEEIAEVIEKARTGGFILEAAWRQADGIHAILRYEATPEDEFIHLRSIQNPDQKTPRQIYDEERKPYLENSQKLLGVKEVKLASSSQLPGELGNISPGAQHQVRRIRPLTAYLQASRKYKNPGTVSQFYLEHTHLQPDTATVEEYLKERSRQVAEQTNPSVTQDSLERYHEAREEREGRPGSIVRLGTLRVDWRRLGFPENNLTSALQETIRGIGETGTIHLAEPMNRFQRFIAWLRGKQRYSKEVILLSLLYGVTKDQLILDRQGRLIDLKWTNLDSLWDAAYWRLNIGPYLWPGMPLGRIPLWRRRGTMRQSPPVPFIEALRLLEMPPWLAIASGFNRIPTDAFSLPQLLTEDGRFGPLSFHRPALNPTWNAWNLHKYGYLAGQFELRKRDKAVQRAFQLFVGMAIEESFRHLFDHPMFRKDRVGGRPQNTKEQREIEAIFPEIFGLQAFLRDEVATAGARGASTFNYGFFGYTAAIPGLHGRRVGPFPPGHVHAYWTYREYLTLDQLWGGEHRIVSRDGQLQLPFEGLPIHPADRRVHGDNTGLFFKTLRAIQRRHRAALDGDSSPEALLRGDVVDPWEVMAEGGAGIQLILNDWYANEGHREFIQRDTYGEMMRPYAIRAAIQELEVVGPGTVQVTLPSPQGEPSAEALQEPTSGAEVRQVPLAQETMLAEAPAAPPAPVPDLAPEPTLEQMVESASQAHPDLPWDWEAVKVLIREDPQSLVEEFPELQRIPEMKEIFDRIRGSSSQAGMEEKPEATAREALWVSFLKGWSVPEEILRDPDRRQKAIEAVKQLRSATPGWVQLPLERQEVLLRSLLEELGLIAPLPASDGAQVTPETAVEQLAGEWNHLAQALRQLRERMGPQEPRKALLDGLAEGIASGRIPGPVEIRQVSSFLKEKATDPDPDVGIQAQWIRIRFQELFLARVVEAIQDSGGFWASTDTSGLLVLLFEHPETVSWAPLVAATGFPVAVLTQTLEEAEGLRKLFEISKIPEPRYAIESLENPEFLFTPDAREKALEALARYFKFPVGVMLKPVPPMTDPEELEAFLRQYGVVLPVRELVPAHEEIERYLGSRV